MIDLPQTWHRAHRRYFIGASNARIIIRDDEATLLRLRRGRRGEIAPEDLFDNLIEFTVVGLGSGRVQIPSPSSESFWVAEPNPFASTVLFNEENASGFEGANQLLSRFVGNLRAVAALDPLHRWKG